MMRALRRRLRTACGAWPLRRALPAVAAFLLAIAAAAFAPGAQAQAEVSVPASWVLKPSAITPGGKFRLLFKTSTSRDATSTDIGDYNTFVQARAAAGHTAIRSHSTQYRAVGCTATVSARANTGVDVATGGIPVYFLNGPKAADDYADFYDGNWNNVAAADMKNESGAGGEARWAWTGCNRDGTISTRPLGADPQVATGGTGNIQYPLSQGNAARTEQRPLYGLSPVYVVEPEVRFEAAAWEVDEGGAVRVAVELSAARTEATRVTLAAAATSTATAGEDYFGTGAWTLVIAAGATRGTARISTRQDNVLEDNGEAIDLVISGVSAGVAIGADRTARVTVADDELSWCFTEVTYVVREDAGEAVAVVTLTDPAPREMHFVFRYQDLNATPNEDFTPVHTTAASALTLAQGQNALYLRIPLVDDDEREENEIFRVHIESPVLPDGVTECTSDVIILDNDTPTVSIEADVSMVAEGASASYTLTAEPAPAEAITVHLAVADAANEADYVAADDEGAREVTLGTSGTARFTVATVPDTADEPDGAVTVTVQTDAGEVAERDYRVGSPSSAAVTVTDDGAIPTTIAAFAQAASGAAEGAGAHTVRVDLSPAPAQGITLAWTVGGTATEGEDFTIAGARTVQVQAHATRVDLALTLSDDAVAEGPETVVLTLAAGAGNLVGRPGVHTLTLADDDRAGLVFTPGAGLAVAEGASARYRVALSSEPTADVTVTVASDNGDVTVDTDAGTDDDQTALTFTPANWQTPRPVAVTARKDADTDADTATLTHRASGGGYGAVTGTLGVTVADDGAPPASLFGGGGRSHDLPEGAERGLDLVLRTRLGTSRTATYPLHIGGTAERGADYTLRCGGAPGVTCRGLGGAAPALVVDGAVLNGARSVHNVLFVSATEDETAESRETVTLRLDDRTLSLGIVDAPAATTVAFSKASFSINENQGPAEPVYTVDPPLAKAITVPLTVTGTATAGVDYVAFSSFTIPADTKIATLDIDMLDDPLVEGNETVVVAIDEAKLPAGVSAGTIKAFTLTILDDDRRAFVFTPAALDVAEGASARYTVHLARPPTGPVTVTVASDSADVTLDTDPETPGEQATLAFTPATWNTAQSVTVMTYTDTDSADGAAALAHSASGGAYDSVTGTVTVTVVDADDPAAYLTSPPGTHDLPEGAFRALGITLGEALGASRTVTYPLDVGGTAARGTDYRLRCGAAPGVTCRALDGDAPALVLDGAVLKDATSVEGALLLFATEDETVEARERVTLRLGGRTLTVRIVDAPARTTVAFASAASAADEHAGPAQAPWRVDPPFAQDIVVPVTVTGTATAGVDYAALSSFTIPAGVAQGTFDIDLVDDRLIEDDETVVVALDAARLPAHVSAGAPDTHTVTLRDDDGQPGLVLTPAALVVAEGTRGRYRVALSRRPTGPVTVTVASGNGDVTVDTDPDTAGEQATLAFTPADWHRPRPVAVAAAADADGADDTAALVHTASGGGYGAATGTVTVTVAEPVTPVVSVAPDTAAVSEGTAVELTVTMTPAPQAATAVTLHVADAPHADFVAPGDEGERTVRIGTGGTARLTVPTTRDRVDEPSGPVTVTVAAGAAWRAGGPAAVRVEDDDRTTVVLTVPDPWADARDASDTAALALTLDRGLVAGERLAVPLQLSGGTVGTDFTLALAGRHRRGVSFSGTTVTFTGTAGAPSSARATVRLTPAVTPDGVDDEVSVSIPRAASTDPMADPTETLVASGLDGGVVGALTVGTPPVTITDTDVTVVGIAGPAGFDPARLPEGTTFTVDFILSRSLAADETASFAIAFGGNATRGADYRLRCATSAGVTCRNLDRGAARITVDGAQRSQRHFALDIELLEDATHEPRETATLRVGGATYTVGIVDAPETTTISFLVAASEVNENNPAVSVNYTVDPPFGRDIVVPVTVTGTATAGEDYPAFSAFTITAGQGRAGFSFNIVNDEAPEDDETIVIAMDTADLPRGVSAGAITTTTVTILDHDDRIPGLIPSAASLAVNEGAGGSVTVRLATPPTGPVTVTVASDNADVTVDTDPDTDGAQGSLTFSRRGAGEWSTAQTVAVAAAQDPDAENDGATLTLTASGGGYDGVSATVAVTVTDDDAANLLVDPSALAVDEGAGGAYTVRLATQPTGPVTVAVASDNADVTVDTDAATGGAQTSLTFRPSGAGLWSTAQAVAVAAAQDPDADHDTATLTLTASGGGYDAVGATVAVTVTDDDAPSVLVDPAALTVIEGADARFTVRLATPPAGPVTVSLSGHAGTDLSLDSPSLTFRPSGANLWSTAQAVTVAAAGDDDDTDDTETLRLTASGGDYDGVGATVAVTVRDESGVASLSVSDATVSEATANARKVTRMRFRVSLSAPLGHTVRARLATRESTPVSARSNRDYPYSRFAIELPPGATEHHVYVTVYGAGIYGNEAVEGPETFELVLVDVHGAPVADAVGVGTITEGPMAPGVTVSRTRVRVAEGGAPARYSVALDAPPAPGETVTVTVASEDAGAVQVERGDGSWSTRQQPAPSTVLRFTAGARWASPQVVTVTPQGDADTADERVTVTHAVSGPGAWGALDVPVLEVTVVDDDDTAPPLVSIAPGPSPVTEGTAARFTLRVNAAQDAALRVAVDVSDAPGSDFVTRAREGRRTVTIPPGQRSVSFTVPTQGDGNDEADGPVTAALAAGGDYALGSPAAASVTVRDDDGPGVGVTVSSAALALVEGGAAGTYTVVLTTPPAAGETVTVTATVADPAVAHVHAGSGSPGPSAALAFTGADWSSAQAVTVTPRDDGDTDDERTQVTHAVSGPGAWGSVTAPGVAVTVRDDDEVVRPTVWVEAVSAGALAEGTALGFLVGADRAPGADLPVTVTVADAPGADYITSAHEGTRTVTIQAGATSARFTVPTVADTDDEPSGAVTATPVEGSGYAVDAGDASGVLDDDATTVVLAGTPSDIAEADGAKTFTVTLGRALVAGEVLEVPLVFDGTATRGTDYTVACAEATGLACQDLDGAAPKAVFTGEAGAARVATLTLASVDDPADEGEGETVTVALGALDADSGTGLGGGASGSGSLAFTITDDDVPAVSIAPDSATAVTEGAAVGFTLNVDPAPAADLSVKVTVADAAAGSDFLDAAAEGERTVTVPAGATSAALTVATEPDTDDEPNGAVTATLGDGDGYTVDADAGAAAAALADDDATTVTLEGPAGDIAEADGAKTFTVTLGRALVAGEALEVPLVFAGTATRGEDYTVTCASAKGLACSGLGGASPKAAFTGGAGAARVATLTLASVDDPTDEDAGETVTVALGTLDADSGTGLGGGASGAGALAFTITDDDLPPPVVTIAVRPTAMTEGGAATFTLTADRAPDAALPVTVTVTDAPGADYVAQSEEGLRTVTIAQGQRTAAFTLRTPDDAEDEPDGPVTATLVAGDGYTLGSPAQAQVAVRDDDEPTLPTLSIEDAEGQEGDTIPFTIRLSAPLDRPVRFTVRFQESDPVSARASWDWRTRTFYQGAYDFLPNQWHVVLKRGETQARRWITTVDDAHDEGDETFEGHITWADVPIADGVAVGTIKNDDPLPAAWLARFGRTVAQQALDGIAGRIAADRTPGIEGTLAGAALPGGGMEDDDAGAGGRETQAALAGIAQAFGDGAGRSGATGPPGAGAQDRSMTGREALLGSRFALTAEPDAAGGSLAFWGRAAAGRFDGVERGDGTDIRLDGAVTTAMLGADYARDRWLVGLALARSEGEGTYESEGEGGCPPQPDGETPVLCDGAVRAGDGAIDGTLTAAIPWAAVRASERLKLWGAAGYGEGRVTLETMGERLGADTSWTMAAAGLRGELLAPSNGPSLALTSDAMWARTSSEQTRELAASDSDVTRVRLGLEGGWPVALDGGARLVPRLETGLRHDGGDAETGFGVELGAGLAWSDPARGLALELSGRTLLAHEDRDLEDRGYAASLSFDPDPATARGLSLILGQEFGAQASGGLDALFAPDPLAERTGSESASRWTAEAAYGLPALGGRFTASPHAGLGLAAGSREYSVGWRLAPEGGTAPDLSLDVKAVRRERDAAAPEHTLGVELRAAW